METAWDSFPCRESLQFTKNKHGAIIVNDLCVSVYVCVYDWRVCMRPDPGKQYWHGTIRFNGILPLYNIVGAFSSRRFCFT